MQLRKTHFVRVLDDERIDVWYVDAGLDDRRADEHLSFSLGDVLHDRGEHVFIHLPVRNGDRHIVEQLMQPFRRALYILNAVVQVIDLPAARQLPAHGLVENAVLMLKHEGLHRIAVLRRLLDGRHIAQTRQRHIERARDGRCG